MNKKIKIIDLLNKIANGERLPERIIYKNTVFELNEFENYINEEEDDRLLDYLLPTFKNICDEVEILEDNTEEIEELNGSRFVLKPLDEEMINKINELVKAVNELRKEET